MDDRYPVELFWSDEDDGYMAVVPDLPGCSAFGATREEAASEVQHAIAAWIDAAKAAGNSIPQPGHSQSAGNRNGPTPRREPAHALPGVATATS